MAIIASDALDGCRGLRHGFFTREGGVSKSIYASLNCAQASADEPGHVAENRARVARDMGIAPASLCSPRQAHTTHVLTLTGPLGEPRPVADAAVSRCPGVALSVMGADCAPVLLADPDARVVAAAHAGWKGALHGVIEATIAAMTGLGAEPRRTVACIGPAIQQRSYEVGPQFPAPFLDHAPGEAGFFEALPNGRFLFDLTGYIEQRLARAGLHRVQRLAHDTYSDETRFFSYRRATHRGEPDYGRQISVIVLED